MFSGKEPFCSSFVRYMLGQGVSNELQEIFSNRYSLRISCHREDVWSVYEQFSGTRTVGIGYGISQRRFCCYAETCDPGLPDLAIAIAVGLREISQKNTPTSRIVESVKVSLF